MLANIINQLFGHAPNIHDIIISLVSLLFGFILLPQLADVYRKKTVLNLYTGILTTAGLIILTINFFIMGFWISFIADFFNSIVWFLLFILSYRNLKIKKIKK